MASRFPLSASLSAVYCPDLKNNVSNIKKDRTENKGGSIRPNIIIILADDLGYGDLSVPPFNAHGINTPELEKMALSSIKMTNFHVAAPVCTPSRAALLTGLFPWRLGIYSIFGTGPQAHDHLIVTPNVPMVFRSEGYHTAHVGKWHLGGLTPTDVRKRRAKSASINPSSSNIDDSKSANSDCNHIVPGPMQHGFAEYVAMMEGHGSTRLTNLIPMSALYHQGCSYLIRNDEQYPSPYNGSAILTDCQTDEAIRIVKESVARRQNFYLHLWYDAPHGPWEFIDPFAAQYNVKGSSPWNQNENGRQYRYASMVSSMDYNIGRLLTALRSMGKELYDNTIVVFLSDNGPENSAGSAAPFRGRKRSLLQGGIQVPCLWQWPAVFAAGVTLDSFAISTDIFPTLLDAAGIRKPAGLKLDGMSILPTLLSLRSAVALDHQPNHRPDSRQLDSRSDPNLNVSRNSTGDERLILWFKHIDGREAAARSRGFKLHFSRGATRGFEKWDHSMFDMRFDPAENNKLLRDLSMSILSRDASRDHLESSVGSYAEGSQSLRSDPITLTRAAATLHDRLKDFVNEGSDPHRRHPGETLKCLAPKYCEVQGFEWGKYNVIPQL